MAIEFDGCNISDNKIGVRAPSDAQLKFKNTDIERNDIGVDITITSELAKVLSLPLDTPKIYLDEAERIIQKHKSQSFDYKLGALEDSSLFKWLGHTSSLITVATALIAHFSK
ncbi:hypothetical protein ABN107_15885 [Providencia huaxiensis]|uniref:hypothetical protein n=1 Tax=Providencia huaxiensis TaxID=2027290 RepID=UPI0032D9BF53